jgi:hypothetical protein
LACNFNKHLFLLVFLWLFPTGMSADVLAGAEIFVTLQGSAVNRFKKRRRSIGKASKKVSGRLAHFLFVALIRNGFNKLVGNNVGRAGV